MTDIQAIAGLACFASGLFAVGSALIFVFMPFELLSGGKLSRGALAGNSALLLGSLGILSLCLPLAANTPSPVVDVQMWLYSIGGVLLIAAGLLLRKAMRA